MFLSCPSSLLSTLTPYLFPLMRYTISMISRIRAFFKKHEKLVSPIAIIGGFVVDIFTLNQIDQIFDNAILVTHLLIVGTMIALLFSRHTPFGDRIKIEQRKNIFLNIMMFSFGGLFSGFFLFYVRSGSFISSAPFIILMLALMLGAEFLKKYYQMMTLQITIYFIAVFAYLIFFLPLIFNKISDGMFIASGLASLFVIALFLKLLKKIDLKHFLRYQKKFIIGVSVIFIGFNFLYFTNIMPPIPLSLKFNAVYHKVERLASGAYRTTYEPTEDWQIFRKRSKTLHWQPGQPIYVFTSVFTPASISTTIHHRWDFFNPGTGRWETRSTIPISITSGRKKGFRGYSLKRNLEEGTWRVAVTNKRGQVLGFIRLKIIESAIAPEVRTEIID